MPVVGAHYVPALDMDNILSVGIAWGEEQHCFVDTGELCSYRRVPNWCIGCDRLRRYLGIEKHRTRWGRGLP